MFSNYLAFNSSHVSAFIFEEPSLFTIAIGIATLYAVFFALPTALKQNKINNLSNNSGKALEALSEVRISLEKLFRLRKNNYTTALKELYVNLVHLKTILELLGPDAVVHDALKPINCSIEVLKGENSHEAIHRIFELWFCENWHNEEKLELFLLDKLEERLKHIYEVPKLQESTLPSLCKVLLLVISVFGYKALYSYLGNQKAFEQNSSQTLSNVPHFHQ